MKKSRQRGQGQRQNHRHTSVGSRIIQGLSELATVLERGEALERHFTVRTVTIAQPTSYSPARILRTRLQLGASQAVFAQIVGVSAKLIEHWESGIRAPSLMARRLLDEINAQPNYWRRKLRAA